MVAGRSLTPASKITPPGLWCGRSNQCNQDWLTFEVIEFLMEALFALAVSHTNSEPQLTTSYPLQ